MSICARNTPFSDLVEPAYAPDRHVRDHQDILTAAAQVDRKVQLYTHALNTLRSQKRQLDTLAQHVSQPCNPPNDHTPPRRTFATHQPVSVLLAHSCRCFRNTTVVPCATNGPCTGGPGDDDDGGRSVKPTQELPQEPPQKPSQEPNQELTQCSCHR